MGVRKLLLLLLCSAFLGVSVRVYADGGRQIEYSPDGLAFTTDRGESSTVWYRKGTVVRIRDENGEPELEPAQGQHLYEWKRTDEIPISYWQVEHPYGKCIHTDSEYATGFHGVKYGRKRCGRQYYSGWVPYCRDCGESAADFLFYMSAGTAAGIRSLQPGTGYYYLCPWCDNLEQAREIRPHICKAISANRYAVVYDGNGGSGYMVPSTHMYNDATLYEGREVTPQTTLSLCGFWRMGYRFDGWNTQADGTGQSFGDGERIANLSAEEGGQVVLYAQWTRARSVLYIDPAGGSYAGNTGITVLPGDYGSTCLLKEERLTPPAGYKVSFDTGGGEPVESIVGTKRFREWSLSSPTHGRMEGNIYHYLGDDGAEDRIAALYTHRDIVLPDARKTGQSFGGWYYDPECTRPAGGAGDAFTPSKDITLYAGWVQLQLQARNNYSAAGGRGAVNLSWSQPDNTDKSYKLYQRTEGEPWRLIGSAEDSGMGTGLSVRMSYTGRQGIYRVPYTGFYQLTLTGAQGGGYGEFCGGKGGMVQGIFYLSRDERLIYELGGCSGYLGGGGATVYGVGGGRSQISSDRQGILMIAGGGGGATGMADGMPGGSAQKNVEGNVGESGQAGGGGGYRGGSAGMLRVHRHGEDCRHQHQGDAVHGGGCYTVEKVCGGSSFRREKSGTIFYYGNKTDDGKLCFCPRCGSYSCPGHTDDIFRYICAGCNTDYGQRAPSRCTAHAGYEAGCGQTTAYHCNMDQGQVLVCLPAYGGSSYINGEAGSSYSQREGWQSGDGTLQIKAVALGYLDENLLNGAAAPDMGKPEKIDVNTLRLAAVDENRVQVSFARPEDTGTVYYHRVESYKRGSDRRLCDSNVTVNTLVTQVQGYRYVVDDRAGTVVGESHRWHGDISERPSLTIPMGEQLQYLHIAAQDRAGNLGETLHIPLSDQTVIAWPVRTDQIRLEQGNNVWPAGEENLYYVRGGMGAPFRISFSGSLCGPARKDYQVTHLYVESQDMSVGAGEGRLGTAVPAREDMASGKYTYSGEQTQKTSMGNSCVRDGGYTRIWRSNRCRNLEIVWDLYVPEELDGHRIRLTPVAAAQSGYEKIFSDHIQDMLGSIRVIADASKPSIYGMESLEALDILEEWENGPIEVELTAADQGSGLAEFYVEVYNQDNGSSRRFTDQGTGSIHLTLAEEDALFCGSFTVIAHASDNVGNETAVSSEMQGISLYVELRRRLEPHAPVFKAGESGVLTIHATGYVDRIEVIFPEKMAESDTSLNRIYTYEVPDYIEKEELEFMIPLGVPETVGEITVRAYKQDSQLEQHPRLAVLTVEGSVLDELRTRLRTGGTD